MCLDCIKRDYKNPLTQGHDDHGNNWISWSCFGHLSISNSLALCHLVRDFSHSYYLSLLQKRYHFARALSSSAGLKSQLQSKVPSSATSLGFHAGLTRLCLATSQSKLMSAIKASRPA